MARNCNADHMSSLYKHDDCISVSRRGGQQALGSQEAVVPWDFN